MAIQSDYPRYRGHYHIQNRYDEPKNSYDDIANFMLNILVFFIATLTLSALLVFMTIVFLK